MVGAMGMSVSTTESETVTTPAAQAPSKDLRIR